MVLLRLLALGTLLLAGGRTVLTRDGRILNGEVSRDGDATVVRTAGETVRLTDHDVLIVFADPGEADSRTKARFEHAKRLYEEARVLPENDRLRAEKLGVALDIIREIRTVCEQMSERYSMCPVEITTLGELRRLCNDAKGSQIMGEFSASEPIALDRGLYQAPPPPPGVRFPVDATPLGEGQVSLLKALQSDDPKVRAQTVRGLMSPPAPHALPAILAALRSETDEEVLKAIVEFLVRREVALTSKEMAWARKEDHPGRRAIIIDILKRTGDKAACEMLVASVVEAPPTDNFIRARIASALRKMRAFAAAELKEAFGRSRGREAHVELIKQMGMLRDPQLAGFLVQTMSLAPYQAVSMAALVRIGREAVPECVKGIRGGAPQQRKYCNAICRKVTGEDIIGADLFQEWANKNMKKAQSEEEKWWKDQAEKDYPVDPNGFKIFDRPADDIVK